MTTKSLLAAILAGVLAVTIGGALLAKRSRPVARTEQPITLPVVETNLPHPLAARTDNTVSNPAPLTEVVTSNSVAAKPKSPGKPPGKTKPEIQDPLARVALSLVGADPEAEAYWMGAINDPNLPAEERKDLIEDLNEDGLVDPDHPAPEEMPLLANRLLLLEELAPYAMDQVNADAFQEAYKDLVTMLNGQPVK